MVEEHRFGWISCADDKEKPATSRRSISKGLNIGVFDSPTSQKVVCSEKRYVSMLDFSGAESVFGYKHQEVLQIHHLDGEALLAFVPLGGIVRVLELPFLMFVSLTDCLVFHRHHCLEEFDRGTIEMVLKYPGRRLANTREQALIAAFGSTLLNGAKGGFGVSVEIKPVDELEISRLRTNTLAIMERQATNRIDLNHLQIYGETLQGHTSRHPVTTRAARCLITDQIRDMIVEQSMTATINGYTPLVTIGSDLGIQGDEACEPFFKGHVKSSALTIDCLDEIIRIELGFLRFLFNIALSLLSRSILLSSS